MSDHDCDLFAETLRQRRWDLGLTQAEVESLAGLRAGYVSYIETWRRVTAPRAEEFRALCGVLRLSTAEGAELLGYLELDEDSVAWIDRQFRVAA